VLASCTFFLTQLRPAGDGVRAGPARAVADPGRARLEHVAVPDLPMKIHKITHLDGDYHDPRCAWQRQRQIARGGAILVRPDRFIAWRSPAGGGEPRAALAAALSQILAQPVGRVASPARPRPLSQQPPSGPLAGVTHHPPAMP
jgi:hypothetical protein